MAKIVSKTGKENFETEIKSSSGHIIISDEPEAIGGQNKGMNPEELVITALASCTSATVRMYAAHKGWDLQAVKTNIELINDDKPGNFISIERKVEFKGNLDVQQRERLLQIANKCPIHKLLNGGIQVNTEMN